jgi:hypothetical protein
LPKIAVEESDTVESLMEKTYQIMKKEFDDKAPQKFKKAGPLAGTLNAILFWIVLVLCFFLIRLLL